MSKANSMLHSTCHQAMGTHFAIYIVNEDKSYAQQAAAAVFQEIDRIEGILSCHDSRSDAAQYQQLAEDQSMLVGVELAECLEISQKAFDMTHGAFDVTFQPKANGSNREQKNLDFGGVGKGYALEQVGEILHDWGIEQFLIHSGTSTALAKGNAPVSQFQQQGWPIGIGSEWSAVSQVNRCYLLNQAISGSGKEVKGNHIINPRTGEPACGHQAAWVIHPSAALADALSTACLVLKPEELSHLCTLHPKIWVLAVDSSGKTRTYNHLKESEP